MSLIHNEQTKLLANALDRASTACIAAGLIAPIVAAANGGNGFILSWVALLSSGTWILAAIALHLGARRVLRRLQQ